LLPFDLLSHLFIPATRSTALLPYTTLFRSRSGEPFHQPPHFIRSGESLRRPPSPSRSAATPYLPHPLGRAAPPRHLIKTKTAAQDRKSTRLNSSHVKISYAVFCLKKKKNCR